MAKYKPDSLVHMGDDYPNNSLPELEVNRPYYLLLLYFTMSVSCNPLYISSTVSILPLE